MATSKNCHCAEFLWRFRPKTTKQSRFPKLLEIPLRFDRFLRVGRNDPDGDKSRLRADISRGKHKGKRAQDIRA